MQLGFLGFFQINRSFPTWSARWATVLQVRCKKASQPIISPFCSCLFSWFNHSSQSWGYNTESCVQRALRDWKNSQITSKLPKLKPLNMNYFSMWHYHLWDIHKMEEKLYEYRHNDTDNIHNYSMIIQALPFYITKQSLSLTLILSPWHLSGIPEKVLKCVSVDSQSF